MSVLAQTSGAVSNQSMFWALPWKVRRIDVRPGESVSGAETVW